jgi:3-(3-hydroxy-phenyl)propionate hydroxylase
MGEADNNTQKGRLAKMDYDAVVVGGGPVGLIMANLLGEYGVRSLLIEKNASTVSEPRAVTIDDESLRTIQTAGLVEEVVSGLMMDYGHNYVGPDGKVFAKIRPTTREYGYPRRNAFRQPVLERDLKRGLDRYAHVDVWYECELTDIVQREDGVILSVLGSNKREQTVATGYLLGCDGAASFVRSKMFNVEMCGNTYDQKWLILDMAETKNRYRQTEVYCNAERPGISLPGPENTRRYEFQVMPGETDEQVLKSESIAKILRQVGPDENSKRTREALYRFHARIANCWQEGRITLHGDAAHLTPPFAGQGWNSGSRDAYNYAWKVAAVIKGELGPKLLNTYELEREPHARELVEMAVRLGKVMMPSTRLKGFLIRSMFQALSIIPTFKDYIVQMRYKPKPRYNNGFFVRDQKRIKDTLVGRMLPQPDVTDKDGRIHRLDDLMGKGFCLLALSANPGKLFSILEGVDLGVEAQRLCLLPKDYRHPDDMRLLWARDHNGGMNAYLEAYGDHILVIRPDRYVAAAIPMTGAKRVLKAFKQMVDQTW